MATETNTGLTYQEAGSLQTDALQNAELNIFGPSIAGTATHEFTSDANYTLIAAEYWTSVLIFTDSPSTLTTGRDVVFPAHFPRMCVLNNTAQTLTLKKSGQTGVTIAAGGKFSVVSGATDVVQADPAAASSVGRHAISIMAGAIQPSTAGGCSAVTTVASAANQPDIVTLDFDPTTQEYAQFSFKAPKSADESVGFTFVPIWSHAATTTNFGVVFDLQLIAISNDDTIAAAFGTAQASTDTGGTTNDIYFGPESSTITPAGSWAEGDMIFGRISRVVGDGSDTMAIDARLHGIELFMTTNAGTDA